MDLKKGVFALMLFTLLSGWLFFYGLQSDNDTSQSAALLLFIMCMQSFSFMIAAASNGSNSFMLKMLCSSIILINFFILSFYLFIAIKVSAHSPSKSISAFLAIVIGFIIIVIIVSFAKVLYEDHVSSFTVGSISFCLIFAAVFGFVLGGHKVNSKDKSMLQHYGIKRQTSRASLYVSGINLFMGMVGILGAIYYHKKSNLSIS